MELKGFIMFHQKYTYSSIVASIHIYPSEKSSNIVKGAKHETKKTLILKYEINTFPVAAS